MSTLRIGKRDVDHLNLVLLKNIRKHKSPPCLGGLFYLFNLILASVVSSASITS